MTAIEWTDEVWNPVRGCSLVSEGCRNCYAMKQAHRFSGKGRPYEGLTKLGPQGPVWTGQIRTVPEVLAAPLHWRKPKKIFVNSMSDLFHEDVPEAFILAAFRIMAEARWHTFQVLTKRPERLREIMTRWERLGVTLREGCGCVLPNVWLGVSVEDQKTADERIPILLQTPAAVQFLSIEPLLGHISLDQALPFKKIGGGPASYQDWPDWVILGGESGPDARPCDIAWFRSIVGECAAAGVPVFAKQLGSYVVDRNDAGFEGDEPTSWPMDTNVDDPANEWNYQGAKIRISLKDRKGGDPAEWPADLRVREMPK